MSPRMLPHLAGCAAIAWTMGLSAQSAPVLRVEAEDGSVRQVAVVMDRGYAMVSASVLEMLGWMESESEDPVSFSAPSGASLSLPSATPFFTLDGTLLQFSHEAYDEGGAHYVPLQLVADFLPRRFPDRYAFDGPTLTLRAGPPPAGPAREDGVRVVVIDAGHGGIDPGTTGARGVREKTVALGVALALADVLRREPNVEVDLLRDDDTFIEVWDRGQMATDIRGERPGIFISLHANSLPGSGSARGFETYFLSEARTDHERRTAAIENAPISMNGNGSAPSGDLDFILKELRNLDHQHWSALLAANIQEELARVHPGPNRGVKQGPLAVITNAIMPAVLVEIGFLSDVEEERLLARESFQRDAAGAIASAVLRFFERYPPGTGGGGAQGRGRVSRSWSRRPCSSRPASTTTASTTPRASTGRRNTSGSPVRTRWPRFATRTWSARPQRAFAVT